MDAALLDTDILPEVLKLRDPTVRQKALDYAQVHLEHSRVLITGNTLHFSWIPGLRLDDWRQP